MMSGPTSAASSLHHHHSSMGGSASASTSSSMFSPTSIHPMEWSIAHVCRWLQTLQPASIGHSYMNKFREQGIEGDILLQLNGEALREVGVGSVGHRLILLRAIYDLKRKWNIELDPEAWRPEVAHDGKGVERLALPPTVANVASIDFVRALHERDERVWMLEQEIARLVDWLRQCTDESLTGSSTSFKLVEPLRPYLPSSKAHGSLPFPGLLRDENSLGQLRTFGSSGALSNGALQSATLSSDVRDGDDGRPSSRGLRSAAGLTTQRAGLAADRERDQINSPFGVPGSSFSQSGFSPTNSNTPSATPTNAHPPISITGDSARGASSATVSLGQGPSATSSASTLPSSSNGSAKGRPAGDAASSSALSASDTPYKSFRVTLDDPCYKVLPAALKKYKINDDWRQYALFICYGSTERCLSYDEKPLLLFQKLKENKQSPVFMLRHIRDVKSPIAIANAKAAARKSPSASTSGAETAQTAEASGKVASAVAKFGGNSSRDASDSSTSSADKIAANRQIAAAIIDSAPGRPRITGPASQLPNAGQGDPAASSDSQTDKNNTSRPAATSMPSDTYAIAIYPYVSEREDEFDVSVGDTFVVKSKAKGWWVVQRDVRATGKARVDGIIYGSDGTAKNGGEIKSGWVPAGCLLETRKPLATLVTVPDELEASTDGSTQTITSSSPTTPLASKSQVDGGKSASQSSEDDDASTRSSLTKYMAGVPIPPSLISSTSTEGILLMDYNDDVDGIHLKKDQRLRVFKRYNHWSYCVEESNGHVRAWLPSWYIGKVRDGSSSRGGSGSSSNGRSRQNKGHGASSVGASVSAPTSTDDTSALHSASTAGGSLSGDHANEPSTMPSTPLASATVVDRSLSSYPRSLVSTPPNSTPASSSAAAPSSSSSSSLFPLQQQQSRSASPLAGRVAGASAVTHSPHA